MSSSTVKPRLKLVGARDSRLGRPTIMDRALAQRYGAPYVHLAAFAIDVDRVRELEPPDLPFAWEVFLTEAQLRRTIETATRDPTPMLEDVCLAILDVPRAKHGEMGALGSQLPFAVYTAVARGILPASLGHCFESWKKPPRELIAELEDMERSADLPARLARHCLSAPLEPPLVVPAREALLGLASSQ